MDLEGILREDMKESRVKKTREERVLWSFYLGFYIF